MRDIIKSSRNHTLITGESQADCEMCSRVLLIAMLTIARTLAKWYPAWPLTFCVSAQVLNYTSKQAWTMCHTEIPKNCWKDIANLSETSQKRCLEKKTQIARYNHSRNEQGTLQKKFHIMRFLALWNNKNVTGVTSSWPEGYFVDESLKTLLHYSWCHQRT